MQALFIQWVIFDAHSESSHDNVKITINLSIWSDFIWTEIFMFSYLVFDI